VSRTIEAFGRLDGVVNNAGYAPQAGVEETDAPLFEKTLAVNLSSAMALSRLAWPHLKRATAEGATASPAGEAVLMTTRPRLPLREKPWHRVWSFPSQRGLRARVGGRLRRPLLRGRAG
jgi:NAD(P)-dependent dehydrogenase (short-subunit alcohol dehydrogenase family)